MSPQYLSEQTYKQTITNALDSAIDMLNQNDKIMQQTLPENKAMHYSNLNDRTITMLNSVKTRFEEGMQMNPPDVAIVNRALNEYIQKVELSQSHFMYMAQDMNDLAPFKQKVEEIHITQMKFNHDVMQEQASKMSLISKQNNSMSPPKP